MPRRRAEPEPPVTMMLSHFSGGNPDTGRYHIGHKPIDLERINGERQAI